MTYNNDFVASKLRRWEKYLNNFRLPAWEDIPDFGLYMEQMISLLEKYLDYLPPELKAEQFVTAATINNYVRKKIMPEPVKKKYYRTHIAYLIIILTLKQSLSIALIQKILPATLNESEIEKFYRDYVLQHSRIAQYFVSHVKLIAAPVLKHEITSDIATDKIENIITSSAIMGGFSQLLAEKLLLLPPENNEE